MNWDQVECNWKHFKDKVRETWGKFSDDELDVFHGTHDQFVEMLREKYGLKLEEAEKELDEHLAKW